VNNLDERASAVGRALSRGHLHADGINVAGNNRPPARPAAAMASTPVPQPISRMRRGRRRLSILVERHRQPSVVPWCPGCRRRAPPRLEADPIWRTRWRRARRGPRPPGATEPAPQGFGPPNRAPPTVVNTRPSPTASPRDRHEGAARVLVRRVREVDFDRPGAGAFLAGRNGGPAGSNASTRASKSRWAVRGR